MGAWNREKFNVALSVSRFSSLFRFFWLLTFVRFRSPCWALQPYALSGAKVRNGAPSYLELPTAEQCPGHKAKMKQGIHPYNFLNAKTMIYTNGSTYLPNFPAINLSLRFERLFLFERKHGLRGVANPGAQISDSALPTKDGDLFTCIQNLLCLGSPSNRNTPLSSSLGRSRRIQTPILEEQHSWQEKNIQIWFRRQSRHPLKSPATGHRKEAIVTRKAQTHPNTPDILDQIRSRFAEFGNPVTPYSISPVVGRVTASLPQAERDSIFQFRSGSSPVRAMLISSSNPPALATKVWYSVLDFDSFSNPLWSDTSRSKINPNSASLSGHRSGEAALSKWQKRYSVTPSQGLVT